MASNTRVEIKDMSCLTFIPTTKQWCYHGEDVYICLNDYISVICWTKQTAFDIMEYLDELKYIPKGNINSLVTKVDCLDKADVIRIVIQQQNSIFVMGNKEYAATEPNKRKLFVKASLLLTYFKDVMGEIH